MFRYPSQLFVIVTTCVTLAATISPIRSAYGQGKDGTVSAQSDAKSATDSPATKITTPAVPAKGTAISDDAAKSKAAGKALQRRAGEQIGDDPSGRALVLGMHLQEADGGGVKVVEVGAATPAFDAGVREGDEILSYQGFSADSYRKWIDGIHRLTSDAPADSRLPVIVSREGKKMALRIRIPQSNARPRTLAQRANQQNQPAIGPGVPIPVPSGPNGVAPTGGNNVAIVNGAPFGDFFGDQTVSANERAMAEIQRLNVAPPTAAPGISPVAAGPGAAQNPNDGAAPAPAGGAMRIGLAGFRDDPSGLVVMVDVGALPPGNYAVGIGDPSLMGGQTGPAAVTPSTPNVQSPSQSLSPPVSVPPGDGGRQNHPNSEPAAPPAGTTPPTAAPSGVGSPQGNLPPATPPSIARTALAQVADTGQAASSNSASSGASAAGATPGSPNPPGEQLRPLTTGRAGPLVPPASGQVNPSTQSPQTATGVNQTDTGAGTGTGVGGTGLNEIGTLTVDQSGTGRMQQSVEGVRVRDVVGQAIVIYSQGAAPQSTLPPNLNAGPGAARRGVVDPSSARGSQVVGDNVQAGAPSQAATAVQTTAGLRVPVAAGIIRLVSDRRPPANGVDTTGAPVGVAPGVEQPANATPSTGQNLVR